MRLPIPSRCIAVLAIVICTLQVGCGQDKHPPAVKHAESPFRAQREFEAEYEQRLKTSNAEIIEQLLATYHQGLDPATPDDQRRQAEQTFRAAMVRLEFWYTHGGRDFLLPGPQQQQE